MHRFNVAQCRFPDIKGLGFRRLSYRVLSISILKWAGIMAKNTIGGSCPNYYFSQWDLNF